MIGDHYRLMVNCRLPCTTDGIMVRWSSEAGSERSLAIR